MRNDIHRVSQFDPAGYIPVFCFALPYGGMPGMNHGLLRASMTNQPAQDPIYAAGPFGPMVVGMREVQPLPLIAGKFFSQRGPGRCDVCGATFRYGDVWFHEASQQAIQIGHECADKFGMLCDRTALETYRKDLAEARRIGRKRLEQRKALRATMRQASPELRQALRCGHKIVQDIRSRLIQWGTLSDAQAALVLKLAREEAEKATRPAEVKVPAPEGRQTIRGEVVSVKEHASDYGTSYKMTVKVSAAGGVFLVWCTVPSGLDAKRGDHVEFVATLTRSDRDPGFAFGKRPTGARKLAPVSA